MACVYIHWPVRKYSSPGIYQYSASAHAAVFHLLMGSP
jgi:hypothetical protein